MREIQIAAQTPVSELMADIIVKIPPNATMLDAVDALSAGDVGVVAVMERG
jgi:CBS domain-containing protein